MLADAYIAITSLCNDSGPQFMSYGIYASKQD